MQIFLVFLILVQFSKVSPMVNPVAKARDVKFAEGKKLNIIGKNTSCTKDAFYITALMNQPFNGVIYAKGFPRTKMSKEGSDCYAVGNGTNSVNIKIDPKACGTRLIPINDFKMAYSVTLVLQSDKYLQQITNMDFLTSCMLPANEITIGKTVRKRQRESRKIGLSVVEAKMVDNIKSWMEIKTEQGKNRVAIGSPIKVFIKTELPKYMSARVTECTAYDGLNERSQQLTDTRGCSLDQSLMPEFIDYANGKEGYSPTSSVYEAEKGYAMDGEWTKPYLQVSGSTFTAFKFSDTANLHLRCKVVACRFDCPLTPCNETNAIAISEEISGPRILDSIVVFNSIEVLGPGIEYKPFPYESDSSANLFCFSTNKISFAFAIAGAFFFFGVVAAALITMRPRDFRFCSNGRRLLPSQNGRSRGPFPVRQANVIMRRNELV